ncbi:uncharacterized protein AMSG_03942 [Thecamonas trahens ATCC 50062]|uniref:Stc1 domain-containing protein n=1 Tax=Thecamonas trahens ATCC 50062 TaxID=461836 RepID=A0A0L0D6K8_THETB|nr:hypothetical protein AMSG_03942 [Thecamonas trahens ATCC 50062]KNC47711.1 hypothetical protein AMSG_03942 [Thecamonas trahens ATCC 50062]|eukprot:XP_013759193.1 hypothetical protein AMSG_03942 [Thecamonas trahens ATCC 50062]
MAAQSERQRLDERLEALVPSDDAVFDIAGATTGPGGTTIEYDGSGEGRCPRIMFDDTLFLRSMVYIGSYASASYAFAPPHITIELASRDPAALAALPPELVDGLRSWASPLLELAELRIEVTVWGKPPSETALNLVSHGWAFDSRSGPRESNFAYRSRKNGEASKGPSAKAAAKSRRRRQILALGVFDPRGVTTRAVRRPVTVGRLGPVEVSVHAKRGSMACSPNNAQLAIDGRDAAARECGFASFWTATVLEDRVHCARHLVVLDDARHDAVRAAVLAANTSSATRLGELLDKLAEEPSLGELVDALTTSLAPDSAAVDAFLANYTADAAAGAADLPRKDVTHEWLETGEEPAGPDAPAAAKRSQAASGSSRQQQARDIVCAVCGETKPGSAFSKSQKRKRDRGAKCMTCIAAGSRQ